MAAFFSKLKDSLTKTRQNFVSKVTQLVSVHKKIDEEFYEELEGILLQADVGVAATCRLVDEIRHEVKQRKIGETAEVRELLQEKMKELLGEQASLEINTTPPTVILVVGVNGVGKPRPSENWPTGCVNMEKRCSWLLQIPSVLQLLSS